MSDRRPSFQFYPGDWLRDPVAGCSLAAQGLWLRLMMIMHDAEPYGCLAATLKGGDKGTLNPTLNPTLKAWDNPTLARRAGAASVLEYETLLAELLSAGVPGVTNDGIIYSRRMVRDEHKRLACSEAGLRGGNPKLTGKRRIRVTHKGGLKAPLKMKIEEEDCIELYEVFPRKSARAAALVAIAKALTKVDKATLLAAVTKYAEAVRGQNPQYIPHPATWFNAERWTDDPATWTAWRNDRQPGLPLVQSHPATAEAVAAFNRQAESRERRGDF